MDEERDEGGMSPADEALRALRAELRVVPSPDFTARVRLRIAERRIRARRWAWMVPAAAAAALLAAGVFTLMRARRTESRPVIAVEATVPLAAVRTVPLVEPRSVTPSQDAARARRLAARRDVEPIRPLVPDGEATRIARYVASARAHPLADESLPHSDPRAPLVEPAEIAPAPLEVTPLVLEEGTNR